MTRFAVKFLHLIHDGLSLLRCGLANDLPGNTQDERVGGDLGTGRNQATCTDYGSCGNHGPIKNNGTDPHERSGLDSSPVNYGAMAD
jgi:hypothetical protein